MNRLGTKAETLQMLYQKLKHAEVLPQYCFTVKDWKTEREKVKKSFLSLDWNAKVIVRSSSQAEDTHTSSQAGKYESIADVSGLEEFQRAVEKVIDSYDDHNEANQVLVQPMLSDVYICGVAFTLDPNTLGNYYVINYDDNGSTSAITSGSGRENKLYYRFKRKDRKHYLEEGWEEHLASTDRMNRLCMTLQELEAFFGQNNLDVEFAFSETDKLFILQVRTLCIQKKPADRDRQEEELIRIKEKINQAQKKKPFLCGKRHSTAL